MLRSAFNLGGSLSSLQADTFVTVDLPRNTGIPVKAYGSPFSASGDEESKLDGPHLPLLGNKFLYGSG